MSTAVTRKLESNKDYPTSDGRPMSETDLHWRLMTDLRQILDAYFADDPMIYVSGNLLLFYEPGNKRWHVSPDVFVVKGVPKKDRLNYLVWDEGKAPDVAIELTSSSTRNEDLKTKFQLYQNVLRIPEYFLFDPYEDYLEPSMQGYRLQKGKYVPIKRVRERLPSKVLGLELERHGEELRLFNPATGAWLPTLREQAESSQAQIERLRRENEELRRELDK